MADALLSRVLKPIISRRVKKLLGAFFNLQSVDLEVAVLKGLLVLNDLVVLRQLQVSLPGLDLIEGTVGRLEMRIPWANLNTESTKVSISDVKLRFKLSSSAKFDSSEVKLQRLRADDLVADALLGEEEELMEEELKQEKPQQHAHAHRFDQILENITFTCERICIEIERPGGNGGSDAHKITLKMDSFSFETVAGEEQGEPVVFKRTHAQQCLHRRGGGTNLVLCFDAKPVFDTIPHLLFRTREIPRKTRTVTMHIPSKIELLTLREHARFAREFMPQARGELPRSTFKACAMRVLMEVRRKRKLWLLVCEAVRDRKRYLQAYSVKSTSAPPPSKELIELERRLPISTVLLFRRFAHELARRRKHKGFTLSKRGLTRKKTTAEETQDLFEQIALQQEMDARNTATLHWSVQIDAIRAEEYFTAKAIQINEHGITIAEMESKLVRFTATPHHVPAARFVFGENSLHLSEMRIELGNAVTVLHAQAGTVSPTRIQFHNCWLGNDVNETRFQIRIKDFSHVLIDSAAAPFPSAGFDLHFSSTPALMSALAGRTSAPTERPALTLSCTIPLRILLQDLGCEIKAWDSVADNQTIGSLIVKQDERLLLLVERGLMMRNKFSELTLLGRTELHWWGAEQMSKLFALLPSRTPSTASSSLSIQCDFPLLAKFYDPMGVEFVTLGASAGFGKLKDEEVYYLDQGDDCTRVYSAWPRNDQAAVDVFSTRGRIEFQARDRFWKLTGECQLVAQQSFWLEMNDYFQTQIQPVWLQLRGGGGGAAGTSQDMTLSAEHGCKFLLFPTAFLPSTLLQEERFELSCQRVDALWGSTPTFHAKVELSQRIALYFANNLECALDEKEHGSIEFTLDSSPDVLPNEMHLPELEFGVRKQGPFPVPRATRTRLDVRSTTDLPIFLKITPELVVCALLVQQEALRDKRRIQPVVRDEGEEWQNSLFTKKKPDAFVAIAAATDGLREFRRFDLCIHAKLCFTLQETRDGAQPLMLNLASGLHYQSLLLFDASFQPLRLGKLELKEISLDAALQIGSIVLHRMSTGSNLDERYELGLEQVEVKDVARLVLLFASTSYLSIPSLLAKKRARDTAVANVFRWSKAIRLLPMQVSFPGLLIQLVLEEDAHYLLSRFVGESSYSFRATIRGETTLLLLEPVSLQVDSMVAASTMQRSLVISSPLRINCTLSQLLAFQTHLLTLLLSTSSSRNSSTSNATWVLSLSSMQLTLISHAQPVLRVLSSRAILKRIHAQFSFNMMEDELGRNGLGLLYFNQSLVKWEPLLEQTPISAEFDRNDESAKVVASLEVLGSLQFNVSVAAVETLSQVLDAASEVWNGEERVPSSSSSPAGSAAAAAAMVSTAEWTFCNDSGEDVQVECAGGRMDSLLPVRNGESVSLPAPCQAIHFSPLLFHALRDLPSTVGYYVFNLYPAYSAQQPRRSTRLVPISLEIFASASANFVLRLSSSVHVDNQLNVPIELLLAPRIQDDEVIGKSALLGPILPQTLLAIPIQCMDARLSIRPKLGAEDSYAWWTGMDLVDLSEDLQIGECGGADFSFQVRIQDTGSGRFHLVFLPLVTILNALPIDLECRLGAVDRRTCKTGERAFFFTGTPSLSKLFFRIVGSAWSLQALSLDGEETSIQLEDISGKQLTLIVKRLPFHTYMIYAKAWFRNRSEVDLAYRSGETRLLSLGGTSMGGEGGIFDTADPFKIGSLCEYYVQGEDEWTPAVVINSIRAEQYDVVLTETNVKVTGVMRARLRKSEEFVMYSEQSGVAQVKIKNDPGALWSTPFSVETGEGVLMLPTQTAGAGGPVALVVSITSQYMFSNQRITVVTLAPRHFIENLLFADEAEGLRLVVRDEASPSSSAWFDAKRKPLHVSKPGLVRFSVERLRDSALLPDSNHSSSLTRSGFCFSGAVDISQPCEEAVKIQNKRTGEMWVLKIVVSWDEHNSLCCRVSKNASPALYRVTNRTADHLLHYHQARIDATTSTLVERLFPGESLEFGWDYVCQAARVLEFVLFNQDGKIAVEPDELTKSIYLSHGLLIRLQLEGITKHIVVEDDGNGDEFVLDDALELPAPVAPPPRMLALLRVSIQALVVSFVDSFPQEICALHVTALDLRLRVLPASQFELELESKYVQVDNCLLNARLPVVLWPVRARGVDQFFRFHLHWLVSEQMILCSLFTLSVELFDLFIDEKLLLLGLRMWKECEKSLGSIRKLPSSSAPPSDAANKPSPRRIFVERARIDPISFSVTVQTLVEPFATSFPKWKGPGTLKSAHEMEYATSSLRISLTDIDRATVVISRMDVQRVFAPLSQFANTIKRKYNQELLANISRILSQEFMRIVNPIGGSIRVEEDGSQLLHGAYNTLNAASKISGTIGTGAALLSLDKDFIASRRQALIDEQPSGMGSGVVLAAKALSSGIVMGLAGVVYQPVLGASEGGVTGFLSGLGKGIVGVGVRPVVGIFDMVSCLFSGARSATAWLDPSEAPRRARLPRVMGGAARALEPYDAQTALVQELVIKVWGVERWRERGEDCDFVLLDAECLLLIRVSTNLLVCIDFSDYATLLAEAEKHISLSAFNAIKPVLAWEIDGKAFASSYRVDRQGNNGNAAAVVVVELTHFQSNLAGGGKAEGVSIGYGKAAGVVNWEEGRWVLRLPTFSEQGLEFLCRALDRILYQQQRQQQLVGAHSNGPCSFGLSTTAIEGKCVVSGVEPGSLAEQSNFHVGDVIVSFWGRKLDPEGSALHEAIRSMSLEASGAWLDVLVIQANLRKKLVIKFPRINF